MKDLKELISLGCSLVSAVDSSLEDGKISLTDIIHFRNVLPKFTAGIEGIENIKGEIASLDKKKKKELVLFVESEFDVKHDDIELFIESVIDTMIGLMFSIKTFKDIKNARKSD
jgi:hypothetical protein